MRSQRSAGHHVIYALALHRKHDAQLVAEDNLVALTNAHVLVQCQAVEGDIGWKCGRIGRIALVRAGRWLF